MFGLFKKGPEAEDDGLDYDSVTVHYEGEVMSPDYIADTLSHPESDVQGYPYHMLVPHGVGKLTYKLHDDVLEQYEGNFEVGQYQGKGTLIDRHGEVREGSFEENVFVKEE